MSLDVWLDAIRDGHKGDVLTAYGLSVLCDIHTIIHLHKGKICTTLEVEPTTHAETLTKCAVHLACLGQGLFIELILHQTPFTVIPLDQSEKENVQSIVIGELTEV